MSISREGVDGMMVLARCNVTERKVSNDCQRYAWIASVGVLL